MTVQSSLCVWVECDNPQCDCDKGWPEDGPFHFTCEQDAIAYVLGDVDGLGWTRMPDGRLLCRGCSEHVDCEVTGHQWTPWRAGMARHGQPPDIEVRWCTHCPGGYEDRPAGPGGV